MKSQEVLMVMGHQITPFNTTGDYNLVMGVTPSGMQGPPPHIHRKYNEVFYVIDGEMEFMLDGNSKTVGKGEMVDIPSGCLHTFFNKSNASCSWLNIHSPKGFQAFFETFGVPVTEREALQKSLEPERIQSVLERAPEFDMDIRLPQ